jgi:hypothetical protein
MKRVGIDIKRWPLMNLNFFWEETQIFPCFSNICSMCRTKITIFRHGCHSSFGYTLMMQLGTFALIPFSLTQQEDSWNSSLPWLTSTCKHCFLPFLSSLECSCTCAFWPYLFYFGSMCRAIELDHVKPSLMLDFFKIQSIGKISQY